MSKKRYKIFKILSKFAFMFLGAVLASIALELFLIPNNVIDGGITGISIISSYLTKLPLGLFIFTLNIPFLLVGYKHIGKTFTIFTLFSVTSLSIMVSLLKPISGVTNDTLLASVFGGIILGFGIGMIIRNGGSSDGTEIIAIILDKRTGFSIGEIVMFFNVFILSSAGLVFSWDRAMYSLITYFIAFKMIDITVEGLDESKSVLIISDEYENITEAILARLGRGATLLNGKGGYTSTPTNVIYVIVSRLEIAKLKSIVYDLDSTALITIGNVEVSGKSYKKKSIH
ncbi:MULTISPECIES: YitT family protein [Clostridium]|uniref:YitT family protein n=1 Tax=Clostridium lapidicellarium TaxID=3240931 RepID=A0ABV4DUA4_9CLOT|nr:YitT family protein [uncultured Clostridium sp.]NLU09152.1 YitT family protein [Clostridiales bacterium]